MSNFPLNAIKQNARPDMAYHIVDQVEQCISPSEAANVLVESIHEFRERLLKRASELDSQLAELNNALNKLP